ncbi:MAG: EamA family transporter [Flavobacteriales bacterium]|nr:EamA family transporter [Flavobacteriales bacterium]MDW8409798.1 EamA family transporter [Flavobacteriales bacterium]
MKDYHWLALISMFFAGFTSVIAKAGLRHVSGDTGLLVRTLFVTGFVLLNALWMKSHSELRSLTRTDILFLGISGLTTALSWIFYYRAIKVGQVHEVALIDKASIVVSISLSILFLGETLTWKTVAGGFLIVSGLLIMLL